MDTKIKPSFWSDKAVEELPPMQKLALLWLFTAHVTSCGWVAVSERRFEFETGSKWQTLLDAIKALGNGIVTHKKGFWIRNYIRHQIGDGAALKSNNMRFPILRSMAGIPDEIRAEIVAEYPELDSPPQALPKPSGSTPPPQERRGEERRGEENGKEGVGGKPPPTESEVMEHIGGSSTVLISRECALRWLTDRETSEWMRPKGNHMLPVLPNWQSDLRGYAMDWNKREAERKSKLNGRSPPPSRLAPPDPSKPKPAF